MTKTTMISFMTPDLYKGQLEYALSRGDGGRYRLVFARAYGMMVSQIVTRLELTTPASEPRAFSADGRPLLWVDTELDRDPRGLGPKGGVGPALLPAEPPVVRATGRTRVLQGEGGAREVGEVEILLEENQLARCCYYCAMLENDCWAEEERMVRFYGEGYESLYRCSECSQRTLIGRNFVRARRLLLSN